MHPPMPPPANTPKEQLDNRLHAFMQTHRNSIRRYFQSCGMYTGDPRVLFHLRHTPGMTQKALADAMGVAAPTLSVSVRRLESAGLVERRTDEHDARVQRLFLTAEGEEMDRRCAKGRDFLIDATYADFSDEDMACLSRLLDRMIDNLQTAVVDLPEEQQEPRCSQ
ncbi:MAG: winged helix-turn-helix transcriptional regulator [Clostridia bacterium]|nr:winged helix-turn-helix transcriptional regulator [Clostridia bacterium]